MNKVRLLLEERTDRYNRPSFIGSDPVSIPHRFSDKRDIEISGFFAAIFSWGNRTTIIQKSAELMQLMDGAPYQFCTQHLETDLKRMLNFRHRTFNATDLLYFIRFFQYHYRQYDSLEAAFTGSMIPGDPDVTRSLTGFHEYFFSIPEFPERTRKHVSTPARGSACKRLNMFLRWMVRRDNRGVDFGIWSNIFPNQLVCPIDLHVARVARNIGLLKRKQTDWLAALELTDALKNFDPNDPVKYDFALFSLGIHEKF